MADQPSMRPELPDKVGDPPEQGLAPEITVAGLNDNDAPGTAVVGHDFFDTSHLRDDLKGRTVRGGATTVAGRFGNFVVQSASTVILARLIAPEEFGLIGMIMAVTGFAAMFNDLGLSIGTLQRANITHEQVSTLFWINVALGLILTLVVACLAPVIVWFYGQPRLFGLTLALSLCFILSGLTIQHQALIRRQMRFGAWVAMRVTSQAFGGLVAVGMAVAGFKVWALVGMELAISVSALVGTYVLCPWVPGWPRRHTGIRDMAALGGNFTAFGFLNYFARNLDNLLIGKVWGAEALGIYSKAYQLLMMPIRQLNAPLTHVAVPALACLQGEPDRYRRYYCRTLTLIAFISTPLIAIIMVLNREVIEVLLGLQWNAVAPIFKVLAISAWAQVFVNTLGWVYTSLGRGRDLLRWGLIGVPLIVLSFFVGLPWGAMGVATSYTVFMIILVTPLAVIYGTRNTPITVRDFLEAIWRPTTTSMVSYGASQMTYYALPSGMGLTMTSLICVAIWIVSLGIVLLVWPRLRAEGRDIIEAVRLLRK